ncbi:MAG: hypothetical protein VX899_16060 [Myxococcota bacterium]|nr:hypothetical protein [Myxococcota bacterium]
MRENLLWKLATVVACLGWLGTWVWHGDDVSPEPSPTVVSTTSHSPAPQAPATVVRQVVRERVEDTGAPARAAIDPEQAAQDPEVMEIAREQVMAEMRAAREEHQEQRFQERLDDLEAFADEYGLSSDQRSALVQAFRNLEQTLEQAHERRQESEDARPGPPDREDMDAAFATFEGEIEEQLGSDLSQELREWMRPEGGPPPL